MLSKRNGAIAPPFWPIPAWRPRGWGSAPFCARKGAMPNCAWRPRMAREPCPIARNFNSIWASSTTRNGGLTPRLLTCAGPWPSCPATRPCKTTSAWRCSRVDAPTTRSPVSSAHWPSIPTQARPCATWAMPTTRPTGKTSRATVTSKPPPWRRTRRAPCSVSATACSARRITTLRPDTTKRS